MRIALLSDLHANLEALSACLDHARRYGADHHVFLGDLVGYGADPARVLDTVMALTEKGAVAVLGNHDDATIAQASPLMHPEALQAIEWTRNRLTPAHEDYLRGLPLTVEEEDRLYVHANAWSPGEWEYITSPFDAGRSIRATRRRLTFCGHVHEPTLFHMSGEGRVAQFLPVPGTGVPLSPVRRWLAIPGSAGQPRDGNPAASYAILDTASNIATWHRVAYDHLTAARKIRGSGLPPVFAARLEVGL